MGHLIIQEKRCIGCGLCVSVCVRDAIVIKDWKAHENPESMLGCMDCGHCMAICPQDGIRLTKYLDQKDVSVPYGNKPALNYDTFLRFLSHRRTMRWFTDPPVSKEEFDKIFAAVHYSPSTFNAQDVKFVVIQNDLQNFLRHIAKILKPLASEYPRVKEFIDYTDDPTRYKYNPFLWTGKQVILAFSKRRADAFIAMSRAEMAAGTLGLGGFYSIWIAKAERQNHDELMKFFPEIPFDYRMNVVYVIGRPKVRFVRTIPRMDTEVHMR